MYYNYMRGIGDRIAERREELGLSQEALAQSSGESQQWISKLEAGKSVKSGNLVSIARALNVSPDWLYDETGDPRRLSFDPAVMAESIAEVVAAIIDSRPRIEPDPTDVAETVLDIYQTRVNGSGTKALIQARLSKKSIAS